MDAVRKETLRTRDAMLESSFTRGLSEAMENYFKGLRRNLATGPGAVFHHHGHTQLILELFSQGAGDGVGARTGGETDQQFDGGTGLGLGQTGKSGQKAECQHTAYTA